MSESGKRRKNERNMNKNHYKGNQSFMCKECEDFGYYQVECPKFLKRQKDLVATLSDDESIASSNSEGELMPF